MSHSELNQLTLAEELFDAGKLDEALEILNESIQFEGLNSQQKDHFQFLKGLILMYQNKCDELIELGEKLFKEGQKLNEHLKSVDGLFYILTGLCLTGKFSEAFQKIKPAEASLELISNISKNILIQRTIRIRILKAF
ncbi:MAG: hypothetical protein ACFFG0_55365 [Candidatus Thorarchaeota archaeon]